MVLKRKRARNTDGTLKGDDPSTPNINEAWEDEKPKKRTGWLKPKTVWYESREKEPCMFPVADIDPIRNFQTGRLEYEVDADDVERFEQHNFVMNARLVRKR